MVAAVLSSSRLCVATEWAWPLEAEDVWDADTVVILASISACSYKWCKGERQTSKRFGRHLSGDEDEIGRRASRSSLYFIVDDTRAFQPFHVCRFTHVFQTKGPRYSVIAGFGWACVGTLETIPQACAN